MPKKYKAYYFDTVTLSNFAFADRMDLLVERYGRKLHITTEVSNEIAEGIVANYPALERIEVLLRKNIFTLAPGPLDCKGRSLFLRLLKTLSTGEASAIAAAKIRGGVVVTDDRAARSACNENKIPVTGTLGVLMACCHDKRISPEEADRILHAMITCGYRSPVNRVSDLL